MQIALDDFLKLRHELPVVDVRSEGEYAEGHILNAINIPVLNNTERIAVGTDYKKKGQHEAIRTGFRLVGPRLADMVSTAERVGKEFIVHCWRGGMRSSNFCQFVGMAKIKTHQLTGGYKAYRQGALESFKTDFQMVRIGGCTGSGKSEVLRALREKGEQIIDLEALAHHKGSAFGGLMQLPQPTTEQFQNDLYEEILKLDTSKRIWVEDESIAVGKIFLPQDFWKQMQASPVVELQVEKDARVKRLVKEYGPADQGEFLTAMKKITKKLGGQHFNAAHEKLLAGDMASTIDILLTYYDKAYRNGLEHKKDRIILQANWDGMNSTDVVESLIKQSVYSIK